MVNRALIVDDNADNVGVLEEMLTLEGVEYTSLHDPNQVGGVMNNRYDVVFLDLEMPDINGYEVLEQLKASTQFAKVPIVAYTVHVSEINAARNRGFDSFLGKPLDVDLFPAQLQKILNGQQIWVTP